jgi:hypothetical protein
VNFVREWPKRGSLLVYWLHSIDKITTISMYCYNKITNISIVTKYLNAELKENRYFVNEVETQLKEKPLQSSQTQEISYSKDKAS